MCVPFFSNIILFTVCVWLVNACLCVCERLTHAAEWVSDLWIMQRAHWRGPHVLCCGVLMRERLAGGRRDGLQSTLRMTAPTAGSQTINRACVCLDTWTRIRSQFPSVQLPPPPASLSCVLFSFLCLLSVKNAPSLCTFLLSRVLDCNAPLFLPFPVTHFLPHLQSVQLK